MPEPWRTLLLIFNPMPLVWYGLGYLRGRRVNKQPEGGRADR